MKKLLLLLLFIPLVSIGQAVFITDGKTSENLVQNSINDWNSEGKFYVGNGKYRIITVAKSSAVSIRKLRKRAIKEIDAAKKELISLKEYLDLGIITQEEFDKKAESLKKILLGN